MLFINELLVKLHSKVHGGWVMWKWGPIQVDRKLMLQFPVVQMEWHDCSFSQIQF